MTTMMNGPPQTFRIPEALARYHVSPASWIAQQRPHLDRLVAGTIVAHGGRILLVQRSRHDFGGELWEVPGGSCESSDGSVLGAACRELWEEAGLRATAVVSLVDDHDLWSDDGLTWGKLTFLVDIELAAGKGGWPHHQQQQQPAVRLDPNEHEDYVWATEEEVLAGVCGDRALRWLSDEQRLTVLKAFKMLKA